MFGQDLLILYPALVDVGYHQASHHKEHDKKKINNLITKIRVLQTTNLRIQHGNIRISPPFFVKLPARYHEIC